MIVKRVVLVFDEGEDGGCNRGKRLVLGHSRRRDRQIDLAIGFDLLTVN
jgi:hypothetical protein